MKSREYAGIDSRVEKMLVVGKREEKRTLVFHDVFEHYLAVRDPTDKNGTTHVLPVPQVQYEIHDIGDTLEVLQHSVNGKDWYFSAEQARQYSRPIIGVVFGRE